jgi:tRNA pseudouridine(55) synthase
MSILPKYVVLEKAVGQTPLQTVEAYRKERPEFINVPMAYAGRLDPMASGQLLVLVGDECKQQEKYHALDKEYEFEVLLGSRSDTGDILGLIDWKEATEIDATQLRRTASSLVGPLSLPYPKFSSRTVKGKPLHMWTLEGRLDEIEIPSANTTIHQIKLVDLRQVAVEEVYEDALRRIESIPLVTEESKALGRDFRRSEVRVAWQVWFEHHRGLKVQIARFRCVASSGTYMRSLSAEIARRLGTNGLAFSIHRSRIGVYKPLPFGLGMWTKRFH